MMLPFLRRFIDERFLTHRLRSTSTAGIAAALLALVLFEYHLIRDHVYSWELLAVGLTFVVIKMTLMVWYSKRD